ncbi:DUF5780 domain-containing protein [Massiliimalia timonensis]|uniref:DUF5780 domain-containing protein n=1 Tax=Massiliimalia timonensis TaxID=1987501 RepID=UPI0018A106D6|nr:DUF5780 domain-containing protein [Massiliimalia timonensis]
MKKILTVVLIVSLCLSLSSCAQSSQNTESSSNLENSTVDQSDSAGVSNNTDNTQLESNNESTSSVQTKEFSIEEFDKLLEEQPMCVLSTEYVVQDEQYKSLYPDALQAIIKNNTQYDIKNADLAFVAWDKNNLPVKIEGQFDFGSGSYVKEVTYPDINLVPDSTFGENFGFQINEECKISSFKAIVVSYETFEGQTWENPYYKDWCKLYEGQKYSDSLTVEILTNEL